VTEQQIIDTYNKMVAHYGDMLPNPEHCPKEFQYYVKLFAYTENANSGENQAYSANS